MLIPFLVSSGDSDGETTAQMSTQDSKISAWLNAHGVLTANVTITFSDKWSQRACQPLSLPSMLKKTKVSLQTSKIYLTTKANLRSSLYQIAKFLSCLRVNFHLLMDEAITLHKDVISAIKDNQS